MTTGRSTADWYRSFAELEARGQSAIFENWALGVAGDPQVLAAIDGLPLQKRQPNLVFAVARLLGAPEPRAPEPHAPELRAPESGYREFRDWLLANWSAVARETAVRMTQTNEPRRCAALLPALGMVSGPLALLELGASAGLCLYPDRYSYRYGDGEWLHPGSGPSPVAIETEVRGSGPVPVPESLPEIVWRAGIDLEPLDLRDPDDVRWLETLVWPEQEERLQRIRAAVELVRADPPILVKGNAIVELEALASARRADGLASARLADATLVIVTSAMLVYLPYVERMRLVDVIRSLDAHWISLDGVGVLPEVDAKLARVGAAVPGHFTLSIDGEPLADVGPHGQFVEWLSGPVREPAPQDAGA